MDDALRLIRAHLGPYTEVHVGALPAEPQLEIPVPPNGRLIGSVTFRPQSTVNSYFETSGPMDDIFAFYDREYEARGWHGQEPNLPRPHGGRGFVASTPFAGQLRMRVYCKGEDGPFYRVEIRAGDPPLAVVTYNGGMAGMPHPCSKEPFPQRGMEYPEHVPTLEGPAGVPIHAGGGGGSSDSWHTSGTALTEMTAAELMDHFVPQLASQGATLIDRGAAGPVAWGRWRLRRLGWEALVIVIEQATDRRYLMLLAESERAGRNMRSWQTYSGGWSSFG